MKTNSLLYLSLCLLLLLLSQNTIFALNLPNPFAIFRKSSSTTSRTTTNDNLFVPKPPPTPPVNPATILKPQILNAISSTNNGKTADLQTQKRVLELVRSLETKCPISNTILTNRDEAKQSLDGIWYLQYTSPSEIIASESDDNENDNDNKTENETSDISNNAWKIQNPESKIETSPYNNQGSIGAAGIKVETANRVTKQIFDITNSKVYNTVEQDFGFVKVGGTFRVSGTVPYRAVVSFEECLITLNNGIELDLGFLFTILAFFRGTKESGWLETTFVDDEIRIGRGNRGSLFILTRDSKLL